jgi:hypothetical protein
MVYTETDDKKDTARSEWQFSLQGEWSKQEYGGK